MYVRMYDIIDYINLDIGIMRRNITLSVEDSILESFDRVRGEMSRGDYLGVLLGGAVVKDATVVSGYDNGTYLQGSVGTEGVIKLDPGEKVVVKHKEKSLEGLVKTGVVKKGVKGTGTKDTKSKKLPEQDMGSFKTYFK